jgi:hypothetical protein
MFEKRPERDGRWPASVPTVYGATAESTAHFDHGDGTRPSTPGAMTNQAFA